LSNELDGQLYRHVVYSEEHWGILRRKRRRAVEVMEALSELGHGAVVYGSVARGDVTPRSDIEIFIQRPVSPEIIEIKIEERFGGWEKRLLVQATPGHVAKGYIYIDEETVVSFPLIEMQAREEEFYAVAGKVTLEDLNKDIRVPGMNKSMVAIVPVEDGHMDYPAYRDPDVAAKLIGVSSRAVRERIAVLSRRRAHGRTGTYFEVTLRRDESFSAVLRKIATHNPLLRRRLNE